MTNNIFMKKTIPEINEVVRRVDLLKFYFFANLSARLYDYKSAGFSYLLLCLICCFGGSTWIHSITPICRESILITFSGKCGYSSLITHWSHTSGSSWKALCKVEPEANPLSISYSVTLLEWLLCWCRIIWKWCIVSLSERDLPGLVHLMTHHQKSQLLRVLQTPLETVVRSGKLSGCRGETHICQNPAFPLRASLPSRQQVLSGVNCPLTFLEGGAHVHVRECSPVPEASVITALCHSFS